MRYEPSTQPAPFGRKASPTVSSFRWNRSWKSAVVLDVTVLQTVYTIDPKDRVMKTSFSRRNLRGATILEMVTFLGSLTSRSSRASSGG